MYVLVFRNYLSVPSMGNNTILLFIMREVGLMVKDTEKIHAMDPSVEDHSIYLSNFDIRAMLFLNGVLS